jgi:hypothetical protein
MANWFKRFVAWIRRIAHLYEKEIRKFVDEMLELAFLNLDKARVEKIDPAIRKKIANKVLADILIMGIDIGTVKGKSEVGKLVMDAIDWFTRGDE